MNPQRLVAALAALAIGFGVTLVGVQLGDDDAVASVGSTESDVSITDDGTTLADEAQQDEAPAEPPPDAEVVEEVEAPPATTGGEPAPPDPEEVDDPDCEPVLVVRTGSGELLILSGAAGEFTEAGGDFFFPGSNESIEDRFLAQDVELISGVIDDRFDSRSVQDCRTGETAEATVLVDFGGELPDATPSDEDDVAATQGEEQLFPCADAAFDSLLDELDILEQTELIAEADVFVRVVAKSLARFGDAPVAEWEAAIEQEFDRFVSPKACTDEIDAVFADGGSSGFFCAAANVSADERLFVYLEGVVPDQMSRCSYVQEGVN